ncbi:MAG: EVE domain-containing protein, partial [Actinomycetota bacterium]
MTKYYMCTTSPKNFEIDRETSGFTVQGLKERHRKTVQRWKPGDRIIYYINKISKLGAIAEITSGYYKDYTKIWTEEDELWPYRAKSKPIIVLEKDEFLDVRKFIDKLAFIKDRWSPEFWGFAFQGSIREIPEEDYLLIESEMRKIISHRKLIP